MGGRLILHLPCLQEIWIRTRMWVRPGSMHFMASKIKDLRGPVRSRGRRDQQYRPYYKDQRCKQQSTRQVVRRPREDGQAVRIQEAEEPNSKSDRKCEEKSLAQGRSRWRLLPGQSNKGIFCSTKKALIDRAVCQGAPSCIKMYGIPFRNQSSSCRIKRFCKTSCTGLAASYFNHVQTSSTVATDD
ncbi:hypothetical protein TNCV_1488781 [Trichonephila clavipes]|nr:hypothetical protein TNCV_1488781 [Trichonephila clavipes]